MKSIFINISGNLKASKKIITHAALFICFSSIGPITLFAQNEENAIKQTINTFFEGMRNADTILLKSTLSSSAVLHTIGRNKEMKPTIRVEELQGFISFVGSQTKGKADERIGNISLNYDGTLASAWMEYTFYYNGKLSHCGINSFQLVKIDEVWKIQYIIDTRKKEGCKEIK